MTWAEHFDSLAHDYDAFTTSTGWHPNTELASLLSEHALAPHTILDLGAGTGQTAVALRDLYPGAGLTLVEPSAGMAEVAAAKLREAVVVVQDADGYLRSGSSADLIVAIGLLELVPDALATIRSGATRLTPGGHLAVTHEPLLETSSVQGVRVSHLSEGRTVRRYAREEIEGAAADAGLVRVAARELTAYQRGDTREDVVYELVLWRAEARSGSSSR